MKLFVILLGMRAVELFQHPQSSAIETNSSSLLDDIFLDSNDLIIRVRVDSTDRDLTIQNSRDLGRSCILDYSSLPIISWSSLPIKVQHLIGYRLSNLKLPQFVLVTQKEGQWTLVQLTNGLESNTIQKPFSSTNTNQTDSLEMVDEFMRTKSQYD